METRTPIHREIIDHPAVWTPASLGADAKAALAYKLTAEQREAADRVLQKVAGLPIPAIERSHVEEPAFEAMAREIETELADGRGLIVIQGLDKQRYSDDACER